MRFTSLLFLAGLVAVQVSAAPSPSFVVHEKRENTGAGRWSKRNAPPVDMIVPVRIGMRQSNLDVAHDVLMELYVSTFESAIRMALTSGEKEQPQFAKVRAALYCTASNRLFRAHRGHCLCDPVLARVDGNPRRRHYAVNQQAVDAVRLVDSRSGAFTAYSISRLWTFGVWQATSRMR